MFYAGFKVKAPFSLASTLAIWYTLSPLDTQMLGLIDL
jgi:hypothetical protein